MDVKPLCPYCGDAMILRITDNRPVTPTHWVCAEDWQFLAYYTCAACSARTGTTIKAPQVHGRDPKEVQAAAYAEAMARPLQKPLTAEELHALIDAVDEAVIYCEAKEDPQTYVHILYGGRVIDREAETVDASLLVYPNYRKHWRAWAQRPTDEERAAAPWEGDGDAHL